MYPAPKLLLLFAFFFVQAQAFVVPRCQPSLLPVSSYNGFAPRDFTREVLALAAKQPEKGTSEEEKTTSSFADVIKENPGTLVMLPFVFIFGVDLLLNIFFVAKRTFEYFAFGKMPSTEVWFSDNFFL